MDLAEGVAVDDERLRAFCKAHGIRSLRLFGSAVIGALGPDSDIDLLVEFEPGRTPGLLSIARFELELGDMLGRQVDLRTIHDLSRHFRDQVVANARTVYDATRRSCLPRPPE
ncbi:MAG TPA: nucleotidyltransferase domain-containing protein [Vicinamibacterales bacterium]|nr:nucleotidyltransferase domain-containing protein [Vicinamibacterales bacterium]